MRLLPLMLFLLLVTPCTAAETEVGDIVEIEEWIVPWPNTRPRDPSVAADDRGRLWFVETMQDPNRFVGFDPASGKFVAQAEIPSRGGAVRHMVFDEATRSIWFGTDTNNLGRAKLLDD